MPNWAYTLIRNIVVGGIACWGFKDFEAKRHYWVKEK
jgi:hypothetical protein